MCGKGGTNNTYSLFFLLTGLTVKCNTCSIFVVTQVCVTAVRRDFSDAEVNRATWTDKWSTSFRCKFSKVD